VYRVEGALAHRGRSLRSTIALFIVLFTKIIADFANSQLLMIVCYCLFTVGTVLMCNVSCLVPESVSDVSNDA